MGVSKILVVRFSAIGDIVLTSPVLRCLKQQTNAQIDFLTKRKFQAVVEYNPYIDNIIAVENDFREKIEDLQAAHYDIIIDLQHNWHSLRLKRVLGIKAYAFNKLNIEKWLLVNTKFNFLPPVHIVDRYLKTIEPLGVVNDGKGLDYFYPSEMEVKVADYLPFPDQPYIAFVTGAAHATKRLPETKIISLCQQIAQPIVLLGGKDEAAAGDRIAQLAGKHVWNACGKFNLHQSASWVRQAELVIAHDTGLMHIAAAFSKKIISIWGNTTPHFGMYPYYPAGINLNTSIEVVGLRCRPCSKIGHKACPKKHFRCMNEIDEARIVALIQ
jgi:ADP-heptose:LPS heptosyltransferase